MISSTNFKLDELCDFVNGGAWNESEYTESGIPVLKVSNFNSYSFSLDNISYLSEDAAAKYEKHCLKEGDLIIATVGSHQSLVNSAAGRTIAVKSNVTGFYLNQNAVFLRTKDSSKLDQVYLSYLGESGPFRNYIQVRGKGAANQMRIAIGDIKSFPVKLPPLPTQQKIAHILSAYDDLIESNLKRIKLLEEMAQITYEQWFIQQIIGGKHISLEDFEFLPLETLIAEYRNGGWGKEESEGQYIAEAYVIRGTDMPKLKTGSYGDLPIRYHTEKNLLPRKLQVGDISIEMSNGNIGNVGRSFYFDEGIKKLLKKDVMCASFCKMLRPKTIEYSYIINAHLKYIHSNNQMLAYKSQAANGINNFRFEDMIREEVIPLPKGEYMKKLTELLSINYGVISNYRKQIALLTEARDILLPRLMTGIINVDNIELLITKSNTEAA